MDPQEPQRKEHKGKRIFFCFFVSAPVPGTEEGSHDSQDLSASEKSDILAALHSPVLSVGPARERPKQYFFCCLVVLVVVLVLLAVVS